MAATLRDDLDRGLTLPSNWYVDDAIFELEKQRIFHRSWQYVGHTVQVAKPGDFFTQQLGDIPIIVVRDADGALRAHANVCRHRGSEVVRECSGSRKLLQCHYHGWTHELDGRLRGAPRANEQAGFEKDRLSLVSLAVGS